jgi:hypothetical protein
LCKLSNLQIKQTNCDWEQNAQENHANWQRQMICFARVTHADEPQHPTLKQMKRESPLCLERLRFTAIVLTITFGASKRQVNVEKGDHSAQLRTHFTGLTVCGELLRGCRPHTRHWGDQRQRGRTRQACFRSSAPCLRTSPPFGQPHARLQDRNRVQF